MRLVNLHIFLEDHEESTYETFCKESEVLKEHGVIEMSVSPMRDYGNYGEIYVTLNIDETRLQELRNFMCDAWEGDEDECQAVCFFSNIYTKTINTIYFTMYD